MFRRRISGLILSTCGCFNSIRGVVAWKPRPKQKERFSKQALMLSRTRHQEQQKMVALRQQLNEDHGELQRCRSRMRHQLERTAFKLVGDSGKEPAASAAQTMSKARHLLMLNEATRKALKSGRRERKAIFTSSKKWRG
uniref:Uncharacterized protein n=1 Tax=Trypanosoma congolense (strain IL3000) TaxID=1068625 RepID=G0ULS3_TRYCI|nr:conserved hypothetical protein [Trypanosoma congolense IL3000]